MRFNHTHQGIIRLGRLDSQQMTRLIRFALSNFRYLLTLFSKFFSSFPHGTCSLSVSRQYLALDGAYHPLSAGIPTYTTLSMQSVRGGTWSHRRDSHPLWCWLPPDLDPSHKHWIYNFRLQPKYPARGNGLQFELIPLHSPLLRESLLVSFPPLNNMLKFRGFSHLIWDHKFKEI